MININTIPDMPQNSNLHRPASRANWLKAIASRILEKIPLTIKNNASQDIRRKIISNFFLIREGTLFLGGEGVGASEGEGRQWKWVPKGEGHTLFFSYSRGGSAHLSKIFNEDFCDVTFYFFLNRLIFFLFQLVSLNLVQVLVLQGY